MSFGIGSICVPNSLSIRIKLSLSLSVMKFIANPKCPNLPDLPTLCKYVSLEDGKSKFTTTLIEGTSIPLVNRSEETKHLPYPFLKL